MVELSADMAQEARAEAATLRAAARAMCAECGVIGGHSPGCPGDPDDDDYPEDLSP